MMIYILTNLYKVINDILMGNDLICDFANCGNKPFNSTTIYLGNNLAIDINTCDKPKHNELLRLNCKVEEIQKVYTIDKERIYIVE